MNLALHHLFAACRFAAQVCRLEADNASSPFGEFWEEILHSSLAVATLSVAALESYANEFYADNLHQVPGLNEMAVGSIGELVESAPILKKFQVALALRSGKELSFGIPVVQNVDALIKLRNAVVHFRPEWFDAQDKHDKLSRQLAHKFEGSAFLAGEPLFPRAWASGSFVVWSLKTTVEFIEHFCIESGIPNPLTQFRGRISEYSENAL